MFNVIFRKIIADLFQTKGRAFLTAFSMFLGVLGVGVVAFAFAVLSREIDSNYMRTNPASASIYTAGLPAGLEQKIKARNDIEETSVRGFYKGRIRTGENTWKQLFIFVIDGFSGQKMDLIYDEKGYGVPDTGEIYLENVAMGVAGAAAGETRDVVIPGHPQVSLVIAGTVYDPGQPPAWMENTVYGYITPETLKLLGEDTMNVLNIRVKDEFYMDYAAVSRITESVKNDLRDGGADVIRSSVPRPGRHPHAGQMKALLFLLQVFGLLVLALASILVVNLVSSMIAGNTREIGIMKATGAGTGRIFSIYFAKVFMLGAAAVMSGLVPARILASRYSQFTATMLNFRIYDSHVPLKYYAAAAAVGMLVPFAACFFPILKGVSITVREALTGYGISGGKNSSSRIFSKFTGFLPLSRTVLYAVRNSFRNSARLLMTVMTLSIGGAVFLSSLNIGEGIRATVSEFSEIVRYDIKTDFSGNPDAGELKKIAGKMNNTENYEIWQSENAALTLPDGTSTDEFPLIGVPANTAMFYPDVVEGRFINPDDTGEITVRNSLLKAYPSVKCGDTVTMTVKGKEYRVRISGVTRFIGEPVAYASPALMKKAAGTDSRADSIVISLKADDEVSVRETMIEMEKLSAEAGIAVSSNADVNSYRKVLEDHFLVIVSYLVALSVLIITVGGLGLSTTMSIQVIERTREIGVLRAIGAGSKTLFIMIITEGLFIGSISWLISLVAALPLTKMIGDAFGMIFFGAKLSFAVDHRGIFLWLAVLFLFSLAASVPPAVKALKISIRETLNYE